MPLQYRKRTKGKSDWWNFSISKSGGIHTSKSVKIGDTTFNISKRGLRTTHNLGNGFKWVSEPKKKQIKKKSSQRDYVRSEPIDWSWLFSSKKDITPRSTFLPERKNVVSGTIVSSGTNTKKSIIYSILHFIMRWTCILIVLDVIYAIIATII